MNVLILANKFKIYSNQRLVEALKARGHSTQLLSPFNTTLKIADGVSEVISADAKLLTPDVALLRCTAHTEFGSTLGRAAEHYLAMYLKLKGVHCINDPEAKRRAGNKFLALQILAQAGIPVPATCLTWDAENIERLACNFLDWPLVLKANDGTWGKGVALVDEVETAYAILERARERYRVVLAQKYIAEARQQDIRIFVVGGRVAGAMRRIAPPGDFRANIHGGGRAENIADLPEDYARLAILAAKVLDLDIAGVDLLESSKGPLILEVNSSPGLEQIEKTAQVDIAGRIVAHLERL